MLNAVHPVAPTAKRQKSKSGSLDGTGRGICMVDLATLRFALIPEPPKFGEIGLLSPSPYSCSESVCSALDRLSGGSRWIIFCQLKPSRLVLSIIFALDVRTISSLHHYLFSHSALVCIGTIVLFNWCSYTPTISHISTNVYTSFDHQSH